MVSEDGAVPLSSRDTKQRLPIIIMLVLLLFGSLIGASLYFGSQPTILRIAVGPPDGEDARFVQALAWQLARDRAAIRLKPILTDSNGSSVRAINRDLAELAVIRRDRDYPYGGGLAVVVLRENVAVMIVPAPGSLASGGATAKGSKIGKVEQIAGRTVGVIGDEANTVLLDILRAYEIPADEVKVVSIDPDDVAAALRGNPVDVIFGAGPVTARFFFEALAASEGDDQPKFLEIGGAAAIAKRHPFYESAKIKKGVFGGHSPLPEDDINTIGFSHYIVARKSLSDALAADVTKRLFDLRGSLASDYPSIAQIAKPDIAVDAAVLAHPGAAAYFRGRTYDPWLARAWRENQTSVISGLAALAILLAYAGYFALTLLFVPARLAFVGSALGLDSVTKPSGNIAFFWDLARRGFEQVTLPWLCRHPRVRHGWTALYRDGKSKIDDLGKAARANFLVEPEVLDAWVARSANKVETALQHLDLFHQRQIYVPFPVRVGQSGPLIERPSAEALRPIFARDRAIVSIIGTGGIGKSTLACALARWGFATDPTDRLAPHRMLPVFIVQETKNLVESVTQELHRMIGAEELPDDLVHGLLAKQRLLVIVDALSERELETQRHVEQVFTQDVPLNAVVISARTEAKLGTVDRTVLYPIRLDAASIVPFIIGYLDRMKAVPQLKDGRVQLKLGERILVLAESGSQKTPITPLLVTLFVDSALRRATNGVSSPLLLSDDGRSDPAADVGVDSAQPVDCIAPPHRPAPARSWIDDMPELVPEVFVDYLRRLNSSGVNPDGPISDDLFIRAAQTVASVSLGKNLIPQDFSPQDAADALKQDGANNQEEALLTRLIVSGVVERRTPGGFVVLRFNLDPVAEYLAAMSRLFSMKAAGREEWQSYLSSLEKTINYPEGPEGYLTALTTCYKAYKKDFSLPEVRFPWEGAPATVSKTARKATPKRSRRIKS